MNSSALPPNQRPSPVSRPAIAVLIILIAWVALDLVGLDWGLPSRQSDRYLFGSSKPWDGRTLVALLPNQSLGGTRAADIATHAPLDRSRGLILNNTDVQRAQIVERFRLYTAQPDEMITLRALGGMRPANHDFDPRLYQYGGGWVYPIGALIRAICHPTANIAWSLDHPEAIGRFYVVMRAVSAVGGLLAALVTWHLMRQCLPVQPGAAILAAILFLAMPVTVNAAHEAKPHLLGVALSLLALDIAVNAIVRQSSRRLILAGACCGLAIGTVLTAAPAILILPVAAFRLRSHSRQRVSAMVLSLAAAVATYAILNPYVVAHLFGDRSLLTANLSNTAAMYANQSLQSGAANAAWLLAEGTGRWVAFIGLIGFAFAVITNFRRAAPSDCFPNVAREVTWLLATIAIAAVIPYVALATGKPAEFGRFALLPDAALALSAAWFVARGIAIQPADRLIRALRIGALLAAQIIAGASYTAAFAADALDRGTRPAAAQILQRFQRRGATHLVVFAEPAPYCLPPVNLFDWTIELAPLGANDSFVTAGVGIRAVDYGFDFSSAHQWLDVFVDPSHPLTWADKPFAIFGPKSLAPATRP